MRLNTVHLAQLPCERIRVSPAVVRRQGLQVVLLEPSSDEARVRDRISSSRVTPSPVASSSHEAAADPDGEPEPDSRIGEGMVAGGRASLESVAPSVNRCGTEKSP